MGELDETIAKARHERDHFLELALTSLSYGIDNLVAILCTAPSTANFATSASEYTNRVEEMAAEIEAVTDYERWAIDAIRAGVGEARTMLAEPRRHSTRAERDRWKQVARRAVEIRTRTMLRREQELTDELTMLRNGIAADTEKVRFDQEVINAGFEELVARGEAIMAGEPVDAERAQRIHAFLAPLRRALEEEAALHRPGEEAPDGR